MKKLAAVAIAASLLGGCATYHSVEMRTQIIERSHRTLQKDAFRELVIYMRANHTRRVTPQMQVTVLEMVSRAGLKKTCDSSGCVAEYNGARIKFNMEMILVERDGIFFKTVDIDAAIRFIYGD